MLSQGIRLTAQEFPIVIDGRSHTQSIMVNFFFFNLDSFNLPLVVIVAHSKSDYGLRFDKKVSRKYEVHFLCFFMDIGTDFEKGVGSALLSIDCAWELICLILGTRVEAVYNED